MRRMMARTVRISSSRSTPAMPRQMAAGTIVAIADRLGDHIGAAPSRRRARLRREDSRRGRAPPRGSGRARPRAGRRSWSRPRRCRARACADSDLIPRRPLLADAMLRSDGFMLHAISTPCGRGNRRGAPPPPLAVTRAGTGHGSARAVGGAHHAHLAGRDRDDGLGREGAAASTPCSSRCAAAATRISSTGSSRGRRRSPRSRRSIRSRPRSRGRTMRGCACTPGSTSTWWPARASCRRRAAMSSTGIPNG